MVLFSDDVPAAWFGKTFLGESGKQFRIVGPYNANSLVIALPDGSVSYTSINTVANCLLKGLIRILD